MAVAAVTSCRRLAVSCPQRSRIGHVPLAFSLTPSEEQVYSFLRKIGAFFEAYDRIVVKRIQRLVIQPVGKALSYIPPLSIGFGAGSGCGIGIGWSFAQVQQEGLPSPPKFFVGCGVGFGVGIGLGQGFGRHITGDNRPEALKRQNLAAMEADIRRLIDNVNSWINKKSLGQE